MKCSYLALTTLLMLPLGARGQAQLEKSTKTPPSVLGEQRTEPNGGEYGPFLSEAVPTGPGLRVTLSRPVYRITIDPKTGAPRMPKDVKAFVTVQNWPEGEPVPTELTWRVLLDWKFTHYPTHHPIAHQTFTQPSPLKVDFGQEIRGGVLTVFASTKLHNQPVWGKTMGLVLGENPSRKVVLKAFPRSRFGLIASKIAVAESGMRQFTNASVSDPGGLPVVSRSNDIGMMQLNAPTGAITSPDQVWDWRANLLRGMEMLAGKRRTTVLASRHASEALRVPNEPYVYQVACVNFGRLLMGLPLLPNPTPEMLSEKVGSGVVWGEEDPDHLNLSQVERDAIRR